ncbi:mitogen-activated protein kinase kinase kinase kinase 5 isoform X9, partial [Ixodes scapularis]
HPFLNGDLTKRLARELMEKVNNPHHNYNELDPDDEGILCNVPQRIASQRSAMTAERQNAELNMENVSFEQRIFTELGGDTTDQSSAVHNGQGNHYDLATSWMERDSETEEIQKSLLEIVDEELRHRGHPDRLSEQDLKYSQQATLPMDKMDNSGLWPALRLHENGHGKASSGPKGTQSRDGTLEAPRSGMLPLSSYAMLETDILGDGP